MTQVISPTPGRVVWFKPAPHDGIGTLNGQPLAAIVAGVHNDRLVNLAVFDAYGNTQQRSSVTLVQPGDATPDGAHATWMPHQIGQAAKTEAATVVADVALSAASVAIEIAQDAMAESAPAAVAEAPVADAAPAEAAPEEAAQAEAPQA
jgi:hypothetical protein